MELKKKTENDILIISILGRLTADTADELKHYMEEELGSYQKVVLDLSQMEYIDSTGLGAIVAGLQLLSDNMGQLKLASLQSRPRVVFDITKAYKIFDISETVAEAIGRFA